MFAPPVCTFKNHRNAKTDNILEGVALSVECDQAPDVGRATLEAMLGPATIVVESGGEWMDDETGEIEPKAHLHWRLKKPAATVEELAMLYEARSLAAKLVGGDRHRDLDRASDALAGLAGTARRRRSWRRSRRSREDTEIDLEEALERLRKAAEAAGIAEPPAASGAGSGPPRGLAITRWWPQALAVIPNDSTLKDEKGIFVHDWEYWNKTGMTIWASTDGSEEGRAAFHEWSAKAQEVRQGRDRRALAALFHARRRPSSASVRWSTGRARRIRTGVTYTRWTPALETPFAA